MALTRERKQELVDGYVEMLSKSQGVIFTAYRGLTVSQLGSVRNKLREEDAGYHVVKNTLLGLALEREEMSVPEEVLTGPVAVGFCYSELPATAKALVDFAEEFDPLEIKGGLMGGEMLSLEDIKALAALPSREVLLAQLAGGFQAPISGLVMALSGIIRNLAYVLQARREQLEGGEA